MFVFRIHPFYSLSHSIAQHPRNLHGGCTENRTLQMEKAESQHTNCRIIQKSIKKMYPFLQHTFAIVVQHWNRTRG